MLSSRQPLTVLKKAEEIRVNYNDIERLADFVSDDWTCESEIVIYLPKDQIIDWDQIEKYKDILNIVIAVEDTRMIETAKDLGYKTFWSYPAATFWELRSLIALGVNEILLDAPIFFDLPKVKNICGPGIELRVVVNKCYNGYMPRENGICGTYIRPEDIETYSAYIDHFEFDSKDSIKKEYALYRIYVEDKNWPGNLNTLLINFGVDVDNRGFEVIPYENDDKKFFAHRRMTCGQKCQGISNCNFCNSTINFINQLQSYAEKQKTVNENTEESLT